MDIPRRNVKSQAVRRLPRITIGRQERQSGNFDNPRNRPMIGNYINPAIVAPGFQPVSF